MVVKIMIYKGGEIKEVIKECYNLTEIANKINRVKVLLWFDVIYDINLMKNEEDNFNNSN